jgi:hypothetical protein
VLNYVTALSFHAIARPSTVVRHFTDTAKRGDRDCRHMWRRLVTVFKTPYPWKQIDRVACASNTRSLLVQALRGLKYRVRDLNDRKFRAGRLRSGTLALHLHNEFWRAAGLDKEAHYHPWCVYERLKRRHRIWSS